MDEANKLANSNEKGGSNLSLDESLQAFPRADGGKDAWLVLAGAFILEAMIWGPPAAYGVFQPYYRKEVSFRDDLVVLAAVATTANGIMYVASPIVSLVLRRYPQAQRGMSIVGLCVMSAALVGASFSNTAPALLATQGVLYAIGGLSAYFPAIYVVDDWFVLRKGFAYGVVLTGTGVGGVVLPFLCEWLLEAYGFRTALRAWAVVTFIFGLPAILCIRYRIPPSPNPAGEACSLAVLKQRKFWIFQIGNFAQSLAFFLPLLWIPSFANASGFPSFAGALALCLVNAATCGGYLFHGFLVDRFDVTTVILFSSLVSATSVFIFWGLTTSQPMLYAFAILWGISGGGYAATWSGCARALRSGFESDDGADKIDTSWIIGLMCVGKGVGSMISGPLSEQLIQATPRHIAKYAYGSEYGIVILFAGAMCLLGATAFFGRVCKLL